MINSIPTKDLEAKNECQNTSLICDTVVDRHKNDGRCLKFTKICVFTMIKQYLYHISSIVKGEENQKMRVTNSTVTKILVKK